MLNMSLLRSRAKALCYLLCRNNLALMHCKQHALGYDLNDFIVMALVQHFFAPADAHLACLKQAHWIGMNNGGNGFAREIADHIVSNLGINSCKLFTSIN